MKLKINKACDLSSISVLPPQAARKLNTGASTSQLRSQQSQQSFSQSQHGMFSQFSQSSLDEAVTNDQRFGSQERENSGRRISCLAPSSHPREESQMPISRSSTNIMRKWNSASHSDYKCQISEELDHRIGVMETSINRTGLILDSVQSDVMQVNKGTKEVSMEMEGLRQKLIMHDNSLQLMNKGQEDIKASLDEGFKAIFDELNKDSGYQNKGQEHIKASLDEGFKAIFDELNKDICEDKLQEVLLVLSAIPGQFEACLHKLQNDLSNTFTKEMQAIACNVKNLHQIYSAPTVLPPKGASTRVTLQEEPQFLKNRAVPPKTRMQQTLIPKIEMGSWNAVKAEHGTFADKGSNKAHRQKVVSLIEQERDLRVIIDSDEEIDGGFSCLLKGKETGIGNRIFNEVKEETERILRYARRRKRKSCNPIIIN